MLLAFDADGWQEARRLALEPQVALTGIRLAPEGDRAYVASEAGSVWVVDLETFTVDGVPLESGGSQLQDVAVSPDGSLLAAVARDGALRLWDASTRLPLSAPLPGHAQEALAVRFLDETTVATAGRDGAMRIWRLEAAGWADTACRLAGRDLSRLEWAAHRPTAPTAPPVRIGRRTRRSMDDADTTAMPCPADPAMSAWAAAAISLLIVFLLHRTETGRRDAVGS